VAEDVALLREFLMWLLVAIILCERGALRARYEVRNAGTAEESAAIMLSVAAVTLLVMDGKTNWFEGVQLLAIYLILAFAFYYI